MASNKRLALSRDQRSVLEAVYAVEKLPDAALRERLSKYLDLSTRQIQVWFQNRRQRAKAGGGSSSPKKTLNTPTQIMDALFEFTGNLNGQAGADLLGAAQAQQGGGATNGQAAQTVRSGSSNGSGTTDSPPAQAFENETFEWGLGGGQTLQPGDAFTYTIERSRLNHGDASELSARHTSRRSLSHSYPSLNSASWRRRAP